MTLARQVFDFYELEVFAAEMYRLHTKHVPAALQPIMEVFRKIEEGHVKRFSELYQRITGHEPRYRWFPKAAARLCAYVVAPFGWRAILRFECWVEERAVRDYTAAIRWVHHPEALQAIQLTLAEEEQHHPYVETLKDFCDDEQHHIEIMLRRLRP